MPRYVFDIETNGFLHQLDRVHSLVLIDIDTGEMVSCTNQPGYHSIRHGLNLLSEADEIVGHNILGFDIPALKKVYPDWTYRGAVRDTLVMSYLIYPNVKDIDFTLVKKKKLPHEFQKKGLVGKHSLESWGYRLGEYKGDFKGPWDSWSVDMQDYCEQDVRVNVQLYHKMYTKKFSEVSIVLEHVVRQIINRQEAYGWLFDEQKAIKLHAKLVGIREKLRAELQGVFPPFYVKDGGKLTTPKRTLRYKDKKRPDLTEGASYQKVKLVDFNPGSTAHIVNRLQTLYGWEPTEFTDAGNPKMDEEIIQEVTKLYPQLKPLEEYLVVSKRLSQLSEGDSAWLKKVQDDGRIRGRVMTNGAVTGRMTHNSPNMAQLIRVGFVAWVTFEGKTPRRRATSV